MEINSKQLAYLASFLTGIKESRMLEDSGFLNYISELSRCSTDLSSRAQEDIVDLIEAYHNHTENKSTNVDNKSQRVYMDGCFDLVHSGHFNAIRQAKELGEALVLGVVSDKEIKTVKGDSMIDVKERAELIGACKWVDEVASNNIPYTPTIEFLDSLNCQYTAHGDDLAPDASGKDCYEEIKKASRMKIFKRTPGISSNDVIGRLLRIAKAEEGNSGNATGGNEHQKASHNNSKGDIGPQDPIKLLLTANMLRQFITGREPMPNDRIVYVSGSFDLLNVGHVRFLKKAKELGTYLIVGVHNDETIARRKGPNYPVLSLNERVLGVLALKYVDDIIIGAPEKIGKSMIAKFKISIVAEGHVSADTHESGYANKVPKDLGIYKVIETGTDIRSDIYLKKLKENLSDYEERYNKRKSK